MGSWWSKFTGSIFRDTREPIKGPGLRIKNIAIHNFRGILGVFIALVALSWRPDKTKPELTVQLMWEWMLIFFLLQPVAIPVTGIIPIFLLPMAGVLSTAVTAKCYFNENIALFILASMLLLLLNNSGVDRRIALWLMCSGDACQFSGKRLVFKASLAAFVLSMFSNRLIITSTIIQYVTPIFQNLKSSYGKSSSEPDFGEMGHIVNNAIQTSSAIGSISIMHAAYASLAFRAIWCEAGAKNTEYPDIFNYLQWSAYAFPMAFVMWLANVSYHMLLINYYTQRSMSAGTMNQVRSALLKHRDSIPKQVTPHEKLAVFFTILSLIILFCRWNQYSDVGWAKYIQPAPKEAAPEEGGGERVRMRAVIDDAPVIKDAAVVAIFVIALHLLPKSLKFTQIWRVDKKSQVKEMKPESGILYWHFVDQNTNYGYIFVLGAGVALYTAARTTTLGTILGENLGTKITEKNWYTALFLVCLVTCILANVMSGCAALVLFLPFVILAGEFTTTTPWPTKLYLAALGVGIGSSFGFMFPFMYTPAYFCHHVGKVPMMRMAKYSFLSVVMCMLMLWFSLCYWAPYLWDPMNNGVKTVASHILSAEPTTPAPAEGGGD